MIDPKYLDGPFAGFEFEPELFLHCSDNQRSHVIRLVVAASINGEVHCEIIAPAQSSQIDNRPSQRDREIFGCSVN